MEEYEFVVLGGGGVGKSCLTLHFIQGSFLPDNDPTVEDVYRKTVNIDGRACVVNVLDITGQEEYSAMREKYMEEGQGFLLVYSITSRSSFDEILQHKEFLERRRREFEKINFVLVGNKCDLEAERYVTIEEGQELARFIQCPFFETSAKSGINTDEVFHALIRQLKEDKKVTKEKKKDCLIM